jgi:hypothetical protein
VRHRMPCVTAAAVLLAPSDAFVEDRRARL